MVAVRQQSGHLGAVMILQVIANMIAELLAGLVKLVPPLPGDVAELVADVQAGSTVAGAAAAKLGVLFPFEVAGTLLVAWLSVLGIWVSVLGVKVILWALGRA